jgi:hypothetical protein
MLILYPMMFMSHSTTSLVLHLKLPLCTVKYHYNEHQALKSLSVEFKFNLHYDAGKIKVTKLFLASTDYIFA